MTLPPRIPVTEAQIDQVVVAFYARVRSHPTLGPVFAVHVTDWPQDYAIAFWKL